MSLVTPQYVQGKYTVAQRDAILDKANSYPGAAAGLANQVPTLFPDGTIQWKQVPSGESGTANANIAVVEASSQASKDYAVGDLLVYNGQLYKVTAAIETDDAITPGTNVTPATVESWTDERAAAVAGNLATVEASSTASKDYAAGEYLVYHYQLYKASTAISQGDTLEVGTNLDLAIYSEDVAAALEDVAAALDERTPLIGKGINLLDNWYFQAPVNQRGQNSYNGTGYGIDRWSKVTATGTVAVVSDGIQLTSDGGVADVRFYQPLEFPALLYGKQCTASCLYKYSGETAWRLMKQTVPIPDNSWLDSSTNDGKWAYGFWGAGIRFYNIIASSPVIIVKAVKLELGSQQTLARNIGTAANPNWVLNDPAPNYQQELAKCQRYLVNLVPSNTWSGAIGSGFADYPQTNTKRCGFIIPLPGQFRCEEGTPSIEYSGTFSISNSISSQTVSSFTLTSVNRNCFGVVGAFGTAVTYNSPWGLTASAGSKFLLKNEL